MSAPVVIRVFTCEEKHITVQSPGDLPVEHCYECGRGGGMTYVDYVSVEALVTEGAILAAMGEDMVRMYRRGHLPDGIMDAMRKPLVRCIRFVLESARP